MKQLKRHQGYSHTLKNGDKVFAKSGKKSPRFQTGVYLVVNGEGMYVCAINGCGKTLTSRGLLKSHFITHQFTYGDKVEGYDARYMLVEGEGRFVCSINNVVDGKPCGSPHTSVEGLHIHVRPNHKRNDEESRTKYRCDFQDCGKGYLSQRALSRHRMGHTDY